MSFPSSDQCNTSYDPAHSTGPTQSLISSIQNRGSKAWSRLTDALTRKTASSAQTSSLSIQAFAAQYAILGGHRTITTPPNKFFFPALGDTLRQVETWLQAKASTTFDHFEIFTFRWGTTGSASLVSLDGTELQTEVLLGKATRKCLLALNYHVGCEIVDSKDNVLLAMRVHPIAKVGSGEEGFEYILKFNLYPRSEYTE